MYICVIVVVGLDESFGKKMEPLCICNIIVGILECKIFARWGCDNESRQRW